MKYLYPLALLLFLGSCQKEEKKAIDRTKADWTFYKLEGDVKSVYTKSWQISEKLEKLKTMHEDMSAHNGNMDFDEEGMLVAEKLYFDENPFMETTYKGREKTQNIIQYISNVPGIKTEYSWDESGKNNTAITKRNGDNSQIDRVEMKYQGDKIALKTTFNGQNNPTDKIAYVYDSKGNLIEEDLYLTSEYIQHKIIRKYDKKNRLTSEARYDKDSKKRLETFSEYQGDNLTKKYTLNDKGVTEYSQEFTYDKKGNTLTKLTFDNFDKSTSIDTHTYDSKGNKLTWEVTKNGKIFMKANFSYDKYGNTTLIEVMEPTGKIVDKREYIFEYDAKGNWIKKTTKIKDVPQFIAERQITYFEEK
ncbi:RHS repeat domain-containing protein [Flavobacterium hauense]